MSKKGKTKIFGKVALFLFLGSVTWSLLRSVVMAIRNRDWVMLLVLFFILLLIGLSTVRWIRSIIAQREEYRQRFLDREVKLRDAMMYALSFSREIYLTIPADRRRLVRYAFILIGLPFLIIAWESRMQHVATYLLCLLMALAGFNLLLWVVASERQEKERLKIEMETARQMQLSLMPAAPPRLPGLDIAGCCIPARSVGGDHYDFVWMGGEGRRLGIAVVDVSGKGVDAALTAVYTSGAFISETRHESEAALVLGNLNLALHSRHDPRHFVSFFFLVLDPVERRLQYVNAGQSRPLLYRDGSVSTLMGEGPRFPLGVRPRVEYRPSDLSLRPGDFLLLHTDGVSDAVNGDDQAFGLERLQETFKGSAERGLSAEAAIGAVRTAVEEFVCGEEPFDDITLVALRVLEQKKVPLTL